MSNIIKIKRGLVANLPTLALGEIAYTTDSKEVYVGNGVGNDKVGVNNPLKSGDNVSELTNDANYTSNGDNVSVFVNDANYTTSGDNVSVFNNDANYLADGDIIDGGTF